MKIVTFGEMLLRLSPNGFKRFRQTDRFETWFGGAEANVAVALAQWGVQSALWLWYLPQTKVYWFSSQLPHRQK